MKLLSLLLVALIALSGFSQPPAMRMNMSTANMNMMKHHAGKSGCCNKNKKEAPGSNFCNFCVLCIAFIVPVKPGIQRNFAPISTVYGEVVQSKLPDYNPECWRPPNA